MSSSHRRSGTIVSATLFTFLLLAQTGAFAHTFEHDPGNVGDTTCATCISLSQLAAATVDAGHEFTLEVFKTVRHATCTAPHTTRSASTARQRGPPAAP